MPSSFSACPYCQSRDVVKRGTRNTKYEVRQLFLCTHCGKTFTPQKIKGHSFPLKVILEGLNGYNTGFTLEESCGFLKERFGLAAAPSTLADWVKEFAPLCRYARMREFGLKLCSPHQAIQSVRLYHRQVFDFRSHRAKLALILQDFRHARFEPVREFLDVVAVACPHQAFTEGQRAFVIPLDSSGLRNGAVHILDYKPQAHTEKPIAQLTLYALALSRRCGQGPPDLGPRPGRKPGLHQLRAYPQHQPPRPPRATLKIEGHPERRRAAL